LCDIFLPSEATIGGVAGPPLTLSVKGRSVSGPLWRFAQHGETQLLATAQVDASSTLCWWLWIHLRHQLKVVVLAIHHLAAISVKVSKLIVECPRPARK
jgi:hypothetical protein